MFRLVTLNLNGIRSAATKGFDDWADSAAPIVWACRRSRPRPPTWPAASTAWPACTGHFHFAEKKGYSGVGLYTRTKPSDVIIGFGHAEFDAEGR